MLKFFGERFSESEIEEMIEDVDYDGDGKINAEEFLLQKNLAKKFLTVEEKTAFLIDFAALDKNGDGLLTASELKEGILKHTGQRFSEYEIEQTIEMYFDYDGDGKVNAEEFVRA